MTSYNGAHEPLAIVGIGCKLPGQVTGPKEFWSLLSEGRCGIREVPADRWSTDLFYDANPKVMGKATTKWGGFIDGIRDFDAAFFGISPAEAEVMDPQQRMLLTAVWEAFEDAGIATERLKGSNTAVFVGASWNDYTMLQRVRRTGENVHAGSGSALSIIANRVSHKFDFKGPSAAVDTACSSSLVATDLACAAIWSGQSDVAVAGGVNSMLDPSFFINFSKANMLSPTGRLRTFDAGADGYVRGEGAGAIILKRLSRAIEDHDRIYALVRGTCVNQDGNTSTITVPSAEAQADMLAEACRRAGLDVADVDYIEAHGTGTPVGDPIESHAIGQVFGRERNRKRRIVVGAGKTNTGHLESAAGITGLIKTALSIYKGEIPKNLSFSKPNPNIPLDDLGLDLALEHRAWETEDGRPRRGAVNSFGFGGTNACAILEQAPKVENGHEPFDHPYRRYWFMPFGAQSEKALAHSAAEVGSIMAHPNGADTSPAAIGGNLALRRSHLTFRAAALAETHGDLVKVLKAAPRLIESKKGADAGLITGRRIAQPRVVFAYAGQGGTWWGMAQELMRRDPVFAAAVHEIDRHFVPLSGWSIADEFVRPEAEFRPSTRYTQATLFALQVGLTARWRAWGVQPQMVIGHSSGELAAAYCAGILSIADAAKILFHRSRLQAREEGRGTIATVALGRGQIERHMDEWGLTRVDLAAVNGPSMVNIAGDLDAVNEAVEKLKEKYGEDFFARVLKLEFAPHSHHMDPLREELFATLGTLKPRAGSVPMISTVTGHLLVGQMADATYWWRNVRDPVMFDQGLRETLRLGGNVYVEIGPHTNLAAMIQGSLAEMGKQAVVVPSLKRPEASDRILLSSLASLYVAGIEPKWEAFYGDKVGRVDLPAYPWEKKAFWVESEESRALLYGPRFHPLLGPRNFGPAHLWSSELSLESQPFLVDHAIDGSVVFPAAGYVEMMFAAGREVFGEGSIELENVEILEAMVLQNDRNELVQTSFDPSRNRISVMSRPRGSNLEWTLRARAIVRLLPERQSHATRPVKAPRRKPMAGAKFYKKIAARGYQYGPMFQGTRRIWDGDRDALSFVQRRELDTKDFLFHPALTDAAFHAGFAFNTDAGAQDKLYLPVRIERIVWHRSPGRDGFWTQALAVELDETHSVSDFNLVAPDGATLLEIHGFTARALYSMRTSGKKQLVPTYLVEDWVEVEPKVAEKQRARGQSWLLFRDRAKGGLGATIGAALAAAGANTISVVPGASFKKLGEHAWSLDPSKPEHYATLLKTALGKRSKKKFDGIVFAWPLGLTQGKELDAARFAAAESRSTLAALSLVQALAQTKQKPRLWLTTKGTFPAGETTGKADLAARLAGAPLAGFARTAANEHGDYRTTVVDFDADARVARTQARGVWKLLLGQSEESEVALRGGKCFVPRLRQTDEAGLPAKTTLAASSGRKYRLAMTAAGDLNNLRLVEAEPLSAAAGEIKVAVKAGSLNFRDIMAATGLLPAEAETGVAWQALGLECAGVVTEVGRGVRGFRVGDRIMGGARGCFRSEVTMPAKAAFHLPKRVSFVDASTIASAFGTSWYALVRLAHLKEGETVLIHLGTGGVGLAAIQIAEYLKANIISTAGSAEKRAYLKKMGIKHVFDSRSLSFAEDVRRVTKGRGVDVVLNSISGEAIPLGIAVMAPNGRFVEIGKRDIYADGSIGLRALRRNGSFFALDMARMDRDDPEALREAFGDVLRLFARGVFKPLPVTTLPASEIIDAFKLMAKAQHIGKIAIDFEDPKAEIDLSVARPVELDPNAAYLVTGGLGGFGAQVAHWLGEHGVRHLYLVGRSGASRPEAQALLADLKKLNVKARAIAADISNPDDTKRLFARIAKDGLALKGVVHSAMVLDDGLITQLDRERMLKVMGPKVLGAWNLHRASERMKLDFFVMFSSVSAAIGNTGQANYVAANRYLDLLATHRRAAGLPAQSVAWGALGGAGVVQRDKKMLRYLKEMGMPPLSLDEALGGLGQALRKDAPAIGFCKMDWTLFGRAMPAVRQTPRFADVAAATNTQGGGGRLRAELMAAKGADRERLLKDFIAQQIARVLKIDAKTIEHGRALNELGLDSLTSFQLKNKIESEVGLNLPVGKFLQKPTIESLAKTISEVIDTAPTERRDGAEGGKSKSRDKTLSPRQEWMWRMLRREGQTPKHAIRELIYAVAVKPAIDLKRLNASFKALVAAHEVLRSRFPAVGDDPSIDILPVEKFAVQGIDATQMDDAAFAAELARVAATPHDLEAGPLLDLTAYRRPQNQSVLVLRGHELITDGWSFGMILREVFQRYFGLDGAGDGQETASYFEFARWHKAWIDGEEGKRARSYWRTKLADLPAPMKANGHAPETIDPNSGGSFLKRFLPSSEGIDARGNARRLGVSMHALFTAAHHALLYSTSGSTDIVFATNVANRGRAEHEAMIGSTTNVILVRATLDPSASVRAHAARVAEAMAEPMEHAGYPLPSVLDDLAADRGAAVPMHFHGFNMIAPDNARSGFEQIMFQPAGTPHRFGDLEVTLLPVGAPSVGHFLNDTSIAYQEFDGDLMFQLHTRDGVFVNGGADAYLDRFIRILRTAIKNPDMPLAELSRIA